MRLKTRQLLVGVLAVFASGLQVGPAVAEHAPETPDDPYPPHTVHNMSVEVLSVEVDRTGLVEVTGTVACERAGELEIDVLLTQTKGGYRALGSSLLNQPACPSTPTVWEISFRSGTDANFIPGSAELEYNGSGFLVDDEGLSVARAQGSVVMRLRPSREVVAVTPPAESNAMDVRVKGVTVQPGGAVTVVVAVVCDEATTAAGLAVTARQDRRRFNAVASGVLEPLACGPSSSTAVLTLDGMQRAFHPGEVTISYNSWSPKGGASGSVAARAAMAVPAVT